MKSNRLLCMMYGNFKIPVVTTVGETEKIDIEVGLQFTSRAALSSYLFILIIDVISKEA